MSRIEQKYSRIRIHVENRTKVFENQNTKNATCAARLEIQNGGSGKHHYPLKTGICTNDLHFAPSRHLEFCCSGDWD